ncbi:hypothetical protein C2845_PM06G29580 [Panicum miliaceum]|uniref:F-box domain-containing protein n=1 Tax=Panicum miliaceum TaxID=4540 RepID=A0A3L6R526_PANMI|nr:hypothetical protein C2845_PM06G29580 [Panicum miliaceum]
MDIVLSNPADLNLMVLCLEGLFRVEERDRVQLLPDLVCKIGDDLSDDVTEYIRLRAVCKPWRNSTVNPRTLDPRFFPRKWLLIAEEKLRKDGKPEHFVNLCTGPTLQICLPTPKEYTHHGNVEGLLFLKIRVLTKDTISYQLGWKRMTEKPDAIKS